MADPYSGKLRIWEGWVPPRARNPATPGDRRPAGPHHPADLADRLFARETLHAVPRAPEGSEPFTLQWFLDAENARHGRPGLWIPRLLP